MQIRIMLLLLAGWWMLAACASPSPEPTPSPDQLSGQPAPGQPTGTSVSATPIAVTPSVSTPLPPTATPTFTPTPTLTPTPAYPVYTGPPLRAELIGVQIHLHREDLDQIFHHLRRLGVGWVKAQVSWKLYQPYPDQYSQERFGELDRLVSRANQEGMAVILSVAKAPEWSRPTTEKDGPPAEFGLYGDFMQYVAGRYQGRVAAYELWNEPNLQREWNGMALSAADFVALMRAGAAGVRTADLQAILISGAPATTGINDGVVAVDDRVYLRDMVNAGVGEVVDGIGVHPYGWANPPDSRFGAPDTAVPSHNNHPSFFFSDTLADYAAILAAAGVEKPLWVTEFGWGSFDQFGAPPAAGAEFMAHVSEWQQAVYTLRAFELAQQQEHIGPMILWNLNFGPLLGTDFTESGYSLLRPDGSPRPAYLSLQAALAMACPELQDNC